MTPESIVDSLKKSNGLIDRATNRMENLKYLFRSTTSVEPAKDGFNVQNVSIKTVYQDANTNIVVGKQAGNCVYPTHSHIDSTEYLIVTKGVVLIKINDVPRIMKRGECAAIGVGMDHSVTSLEDSEVIAVCVPPEQAYNIGEERICQK